MIAIPSKSNRSKTDEGINSETRSNLLIGLYDIKPKTPKPHMQPTVSHDCRVENEPPNPQIICT